jgi:competence ComEA-like helix-hairpin-helix protein
MFSPRQQWVALAIGVTLLSAYGALHLLHAGPEAQAPPAAVEGQRTPGLVAEPAEEAAPGGATLLPAELHKRLSPGKVTSGPSFPVNVNTASAAQLDAVPGIGPATAAHILEARARLGGFKSLEDLKEVKGIKDKRLAKLAPYLTTGSPPEH